MDKLFFLFLIILPISTLCSDEDFYYKICEKKFTENNMLQANINNILFDMVAKSSLGGYAVSSYAAADGNNTVYGVTRCQGAMSVQACSACITKATQEIRIKCPDSAKTRIWYEKCFLRYDTDNFLGKADKDIPYVWSTNNAAENPKAFKEAVGELMGEVIEAAAKGINKFGYGQKHVSDKINVYGLAQCTRDLGESECNACLQYDLNATTAYCGNQDGCRLFGSSCFLGYEIYDFFSFNATGGAAAAAPAPSIVTGN